MSYDQDSWMRIVPDPAPQQKQWLVRTVMTLAVTDTSPHYLEVGFWLEKYYDFGQSQHENLVRAVDAVIGGWTATSEWPAAQAGAWADPAKDTNRNPFDEPIRDDGRCAKVKQKMARLSCPLEYPAEQKETRPGATGRELLTNAHSAVTEK